MSKKSVLIGAILVFVAVGFGAAMIIGFHGLKANPQLDFKTTPPIANVNPTVKGFNDAFVEISKQVTPSIVFIDVTGEAKKNEEKNNNNFDFFFGPDSKMDQQPIHGSGSGVVISKDGYIMTNNHVVKDASEKGIKVVLMDKREFQAKLIGTDPNTDIAIIKIEADNLTVASVGNSDNVQVGEWVLAIGNPLGLNNTVTAGIVSSLGRNIRLDNNSYAINNFIQTDAVINPGNSGGALVDINGYVIGINAAIQTTNGYYQGYGFAIPINLAKNVAQDLIKYGKVERGYIGVQIKDIDDQEAKAFGLDKARGVMVQNIVKGGAGEEAGIKPGDIILKIDNKEVNAANELQTIIGSHKPGESVSIIIWRDKSEKNISVTLKPKTDDQVVSNNNKKDETKSDLQSKKFEKVGITVENIDANIKSKYDVSEGVIISEVNQYSQAFERGLRAGFVITEANQQKISNVDDLNSIIGSKSTGDLIVLKVVLSNKEIRMVVIKVQ